MQKYITHILLVLFTLCSLLARGQFYNGHQMDFGKNRVQYNDFYWSYFRFEKFDTYFNQDGEAIARFTGEHADKEILKYEQLLNHKLNKRLIFLVYNKFSDFKQSNVGLVTGKQEHNTGGITKIKNNKVSLYFQGNHQEYLRQMRSAIAEVIVLEMIYGNKLSDNLASSSLIDLPEWYLKGLTSYLSEDWNIETESRVKADILNQRYKKFNRLSGDDAIYAGHSFWKYINDYYGGSVISDIINLTRINKNANTALISVLGVSFKDLTAQWLSYYQEYFNDDFANYDSIPGDAIPVKHKTDRVIYQSRVNQDGNKIAYVSNELGQVKVWVYDTENEKNDRILKQGYKIKQINDYTYPIIEWHPSGKFLTIITEKEGGLKLMQYALEKDEMTERNLLYFDKILDFDYSDDGSKMVFSAVKNSLTDIYVYNLASSSSEQITSDLADDFNPNFINQSTQILFSSNRSKDTIGGVLQPTNKQFDLFVYDYKNKNKMLQRLTNTITDNETYPFEIKNQQYLYLSDQSGIRNLYTGKYDSTISFIDTAIHYRYFLKQQPLTNYASNILEYDLNKNKNFQSIVNYQNGKYSIYKQKTPEIFDITESSLQTSNYKKQINKTRIQEDSASYASQTSSIIDSSKIFSKEDNYVNVNNYVFEIEKPHYNYKYHNIKIDTSKKLNEFPKIQIYQRTFYTDHVVSQVDFSFLNSTYQAFTGGAVYFNPGFNALLKIGAYDLLEDYKLIAGVRFSADFNSNEYLVSVENLKKKIDEQFIYHRQSFESIGFDFIKKTQTNKFMYVRTLPFNQITALKGTVTLRHDKQIAMSIDRNSLQAPDLHKLWGGLKLEYIFDNTISKGVNLYNGSRYKIFGEYYNQVNKSKTDLFVVGADFRHYQKIHKDLIWATRFAASTSFGNSKLIYYLGGVDNWTNFSQQTLTFIPLDEIPIDENEDYAYQAVATNMRGFPQNIRNGNSFALINTELRVPVVKYFTNYPLSSNFWTNLQVIGFFDVGTAWSGLTPYSKENAYDNQVIDNNSVVVTVDMQRDPIVSGFGFGARMMLFGYFTRFDWAWGVENQEILPPIFYFSFNLDF